MNWFHKKRSLFWNAEKGTKSWWGLCTKVQNMFGISIPGFWSITISIFKTRWFQCRLVWNFWKKKVKRCWAAAAMCNDKQRIELYPATSSIKKREPHHYLQPPTQCQFCLESTNARSSCDEQPAVMRILVSTQHLHPLDTNSLVQPSRLEKKGRGSIVIFPRSVRVKRFLSPKATILEPQVLTDGQL